MQIITIPVIRGRLVREMTLLEFEGQDWREYNGKLQIMLSASPEYGTLHGLQSHLFGYDAQVHADTKNIPVISVGRGGHLGVTTGGVLAQIAWAWGCTADDIIIDEVILRQVRCEDGPPTFSRDISVEASRS